MPRLLLAVVLLLLQASALPAGARVQPALAQAELLELMPEQAAAEPDAEAPAAPESDVDLAAEVDAAEAGGTIRVDGNRDDTVIARRLREILEASGRYEGLGVEVRDGLVFLTGTAASDGHREWAGALARRTEDVVAVINDIAVTPEPVVEAGAVTREVRELWATFVRSLPLIGLGLIVLGTAFIIARAIGRLIRGPLDRFTGSVLLRNVITKTLAVLTILFGLYLFLRITGLEQIALTVVSGTGIIGLIIGFAFRDIAENFLASILLSVQTPFRIGDVIEVEGYTGIVRKVTARGTLLVDFEGNHIQIANSTVYKSTIKNITANPKLRLTFTLGIGFDASVTRAQQTIVGILTQHPAVLGDPKPMVLVEELGSATINLRIYYWIDGHAHSGLKVNSAVMRASLRALEDEGVGMPDEAREIIFPQGVPLQPVATDGGADAAPALPAGSASRGPAAAPEALALDREITLDAEGGLGSEVADIQKQADASRDPESGDDILPRDA